MKNPWTKWYWTDYESDPALRQCSLAAQGLWMRLLCVCAKSEPVGFLTIAGVPLDLEGISRHCAISESEAEPLMAELSKWGVFSRDRKGRIYSRRMVRDAKKSAVAAKNGKKGGSPKLCNQRENQPLVNPQVKPPDKPQKPEARSQNTLSLRSRGSPEPEEPKQKKSGAGTRLPDDWTLPKDWGNWAVEQGLTEFEVRRQADIFKDYWAAQPASKGRKADWKAAWRNWVRRVPDFGRGPPPRASNASSLAKI